MRELTGHQVNPANERIKITVLDEAGAGGACHHYAMGVNCPGEDDHWVQELKFQNGPIAEAGVNGITHEALIAILIDRLESFQVGPYACSENAGALSYLRSAQTMLLGRTRARMERGVEGTSAR